MRDVGAEILEAMNDEENYGKKLWRMLWLRPYKSIGLILLGIVAIYNFFTAEILLFDKISTDFEKINGYSMEEVEWIKIKYLPDEYRDDRDDIQHKMVSIDGGDLVLRLKIMLGGVYTKKFDKTPYGGLRFGFDLRMEGEYQNDGTMISIYSTEDGKAVHVNYGQEIKIYALAE
ncbi:MAG: hypothetical protein IJO16_04660 [Clostridia bacterium]|nr:hypothetical protein [Clostridia bacterium]